MRRVNKWANVVLLATSTALALLAGEVFLRLSGIGEEYKWPLVLASKDSKLRFRPSSQQILETSEYVFTAETNSHGRRDIEWTPEMMADTRNIILVGDSFVMGYGVNHESTMASLLEQRARVSYGDRLEVFNFGIEGISIPEYKELVAEAIATPIKARMVVVVVFVGNDFQMTRLAEKARPEGNQIRRKSELIAKEIQLLSLVRTLARKSVTIQDSFLWLGNITGIPTYQSDQAWIFRRDQSEMEKEFFERRLQVLGAIHESCLQAERELAIIIVPNKTQVENSGALTGALYDGNKPNRLIAKYCKEHDLKCLDLLPVLVAAHAESHTPLYYPMDRHFTVTGNEVAAGAIFEWLEERFGIFLSLRKSSENRDGTGLQTQTSSARY